MAEPFRVTSFGSPGPQLLGPGLPELSLTENKLVVTMGEQTGNIWVLDNVDR